MDRLVFLSAVGLMVKVSLGIQFAIVFTGLRAATFRNWRPKAHWIATAGSLPVFTFALYWIFAGSPASFFLYLRNAGYIAAGYSDSMSYRSEEHTSELQSLR